MSFEEKTRKVFVGGLEWKVRDDDLRQAFSEFGDVEEAKVVMDRFEHDKSRGFGFVTFVSAESVPAAIAGMNEKELHGRTVRVNEADNSPRPGGGASFRGGRGGFGGYGGRGGGFQRNDNYGGNNGGYGGGYGGNYGRQESYGEQGSYGGGQSYGGQGGYGGAQGSGYGQQQGGY